MAAFAMHEKHLPSLPGLASIFIFYPALKALAYDLPFRKRGLILCAAFV